MATGKASSPAKSSLQSKRSQPLRDPYFAKLISKAFGALDILKQSSEPLSLNDVVQHLGGAKSSVFRILHTLESLSFVEKDSAGRYFLSPQRRASERAPFLSRLMRAGIPKLKDLNREFQETSSLAALFDNHIEVVGVMESPHIVRMSNSAGRILPPHASSLGKVITAFQSEDRQEQLIRSYGIYRYTPNTITDEAALKQEFEHIRARGYSTDCEENAMGGICFGAPIFAWGSEAVAAISVSVPTMRLNDESRQKIISWVQRAGDELTKELKQV